VPAESRVGGADRYSQTTSVAVLALTSAMVEVAPRGAQRKNQTLEMVGFAAMGSNAGDGFPSGSPVSMRNRLCRIEVAAGLAKIARR